MVAAGILLLAYPAWRGYDTLPAVDRSQDREARKFFDRLTSGLEWNQSILASDLNWQLHNGMDYYAKYTRPELGVQDTTEALLYFPLLVESNRAAGVDVAVTDAAAAMLTAAYGPLLPLERDTRAPAPAFSERVRRFPAGARYILALLEPYPDKPIDQADFASALAWLTGNGLHAPTARYNLIAGRIGEKPAVVRSSATPFRAAAQVDGISADVRIECWLPADTIRRMGFGRIIVGRTPVATLDRGVVLVAFDERGRALGVEYGWTLLSPQPRWVIRHDQTLSPPGSHEAP